jgi:hypothetical protein
MGDYEIGIESASFFKKEAKNFRFLGAFASVGRNIKQ